MIDRVLTVDEKIRNVQDERLEIYNLKKKMKELEESSEPETEYDLDSEIKVVFKHK